MKRFAISDIHGCLQTFQDLLEEIQFSKSDELYLLGDYIDRGPKSKGVIDHIWKLQSEGYSVFCLKGNHEQMMIDSFYSMSKQKHWLIHGGRTTIESFDVQKMNGIPQEYFHWLYNLPHYLETDGYILVHAGLNFSEENPLADETAMLWIRKWRDSFNPQWLDGRVIVHGHTPILRSEIEAQLAQLDQVPVIDIDGGCVFRELEYQELCAFDLDERRLYFQRRNELAMKS